MRAQPFSAPSCACSTEARKEYFPEGGGVLGVIGPGVGAGFVSDIRGFERDGRISRAIQALRAFLADAEAPVGIVTKGKDENGIVGRLRGGGTCGKLFCWCWILAKGECGQACKKQRCREQKVFVPLRHTVDGSPGH